MQSLLNSNLWIDLNGKIHRLSEDEFHNDVASIHHEIAAKFYPDEKYPGDVLIKLGWIRISSSTSTKKMLQLKEITQSQLNTLYDLGLLSQEILNKL